jgi:penicillin amidase
LHGAGFDVVGSVPFGYPLILFGHNDHIAWGGTAGVGDQIDIYAEQLNPSNQFQYRFNNQWLTMEKRIDTIFVKDNAPVSLDIYRTVHGFIVHFDVANNRAFAKKRTWEGFEVQSLVAWIDQTRAKNYQQWLKAASQYALSINWFYADRKGNIGHVHAGRYPIRKADHDSRLPVPGTGEMEWIGIQPFSHNPQVYNPKQGFITNWNNKPADYWDGPDFWFWNWGLADRVQAIINLLKEKEKFTSEEIWDMNKKISFFDQNVGYFLPFLKQAVKGIPDSREEQAVALLVSWDAKRVDSNSDGKYDNPAQVIMDRWFELALKNTLEDDLGPFFPWYTDRGPCGPGEVTTGAKILYNCFLGEKSSIENKYDFLNGVPAQQVVLTTLKEALNQLETEYGTADMSQWQASVTPHVFSPINFAGVPQTDPDGGLSLPIWMNRGTQNHMVVLKPGKIDGVNVCPPGQSGFIAPNNAKDKHYSDQMDLYKNFESKPMLFELHDVKANMESVIHLKIE